ncbi:unnamed protein product [Caenorhabditis brenneri]
MEGSAITITIPGNPNGKAAESLSKMADVLRLGTHNCYSMKNEKLSTAVKYCMDSRNHIVSLQDTKHQFLEVDHTDYKVYAIPRETKTCEMNLSFNANSWKGLEGATIKVPFHMVEAKNEENPDDKEENEEEEEEDEEKEEEGNSKKIDKTEEINDQGVYKKPGKLHRDYGMAFYVRKSCGVEVIEVKPLHPRIALLRFKFNGVEIYLLSVYAPSPAKPVTASRFFRMLSFKYGQLNKSFNGLIILNGDWNAFPGNSNTGLLSPWIHKNTWGTSNAHGATYYRFLYSTGLYHLNSIFVKESDRKWTWNGNGKGAKIKKTEIDAYLCSRTDIIEDVDVFPKTDGSKDHRMVSSVWRISSKYEVDRKLKIQQEEALRQYKLAGRGTDYGAILNVIKKELDRMELQSTDFTQLYFLGKKDGSRTNSSREFEIALERHLERMYVSDEQHEDVSHEEDGVFSAIKLDEVRLALAEVGISSKHKHFDSLTKTLNTAAQNYAIRKSWRTVVFELPRQTMSMKKAEDYEFIGKIPLVAQAFTNILAERLNKTLGKYIYCDRWTHKMELETIEKQRSDVATENTFIITKLLKKEDSNDKMDFVLFFKYKDPLHTVITSSVLESLKKAKVPKNLFLLISSLVTNVNIRVEGTDIEIEGKNRGLQLGKVAGTLLLNSVLRMVFDEVDKKYPLNIKVGDIDLKRINFDDEIVIFSENLQTLQSHLSALNEVSKKHGLSIDIESIRFLPYQIRTKPKLYIDGVTVQPESEETARLACHAGKLFKRIKDDRKEIERQMGKIWDRIHELQSINLLKSKKENTRFFKIQLVPLLFNRCETWDSSKNTLLRDVPECLNIFKKALDIENVDFNIVAYYLYKQVHFIKTQLDKKGLCWELINHWRLGDSYQKLAADFKTFLQAKLKTAEAKVKNLYVGRGSLDSSNLLTYIFKNEETEDMWLQFVADCESNAQ